MIRSLAGACLTLWLAGLSLAHAAEPLSAEKVADIRKLMEASGALRIGQMITQNAVGQISPGLKTKRVRRVGQRAGKRGIGHGQIVGADHGFGADGAGRHKAFGKCRAGQDQQGKGKGRAQHQRTWVVAASISSAAVMTLAFSSYPRCALISSVTSRTGSTELSSR